MERCFRWEQIKIPSGWVVWAGDLEIGRKFCVFPPDPDFLPPYHASWSLHSELDTIHIMLQLLVEFYYSDWSLGIRFYFYLLEQCTNPSALVVSLIRSFVFDWLFFLFFLLLIASSSCDLKKNGLRGCLILNLILFAQK